VLPGEISCISVRQEKPGRSSELQGVHLVNYPCNKKPTEREWE